MKLPFYNLLMYVVRTPACLSFPINCSLHLLGLTGEICVLGVKALHLCLYSLIRILSENPFLKIMCELESLRIPSAVTDIRIMLM